MKKLLPALGLLLLAVLLVAQTTQPTPANVGQTVTFSVTVATGTPPFSYQWEKGPSGATTLTPIAGATAASYVVPNVQLSDAGVYGVTVSNSAGSTSATTTLTVVVPVIPPGGAAASWSAK